MSLEAQFLHTTARTGGEYARRTLGRDSISLPREVLATYNGIASVFPDRRNTISEDIATISVYMPFLIALNEAADLGISARLERRNSEQHHFIPLLELENKTFSDLRLRSSQFNSEYPELAYVTTNAEKDLMFLSEHRSEFAVDQYPQFIEIDSAIFVASTLNLLYPGELQANGFFISQEVDSIEDLGTKYSPFLLSQNDKKEYHSFMKGVRALHAVEMCMKVLDDKKGKTLDTRLNIPNFFVWMAHQSGGRQTLKELHDKYLSIAEQGGISKGIVVATEAMASLSSVIKSNHEVNGVAWNDTPESYLSKVGMGRITTTLRHELLPLIYTLFKQK